MSLSNFANKRKIFSNLLKITSSKSLFSTKPSHVVVKSPYHLPELNSHLVNQPLPNFMFEQFLQPSRKDLVSITDGWTAKELTFGEVFYGSTSLAKQLITHLGIQPGDRIGVVSPNHLHYITIFLGIASAKAISTCTNPLNTESELAYQLEKTNAKGVFVHSMCLEKVLKIAKPEQWIVLIDEVSDPKILEILKTSQNRIIHMKDLMDTKPTKDAENILDYDKKIFDPHSVITIPFSSGTTGRSKGVLLSHRNLNSNIIQFAPQEEGLTTRTINMVPLPFFHIYGKTAGLLVSHYYGSQVVFMASFDLQKFLELVQTYQVTRAFLVPPIILGLAKHPIVDKYKIESMREILSGAAPLGLDLQVAAANRLKCIVKQAWGMTEISPIGTIMPQNEMLGTLEGKATSGPLASHTEGKIVNPLTGEDLPFHTEGELLVRGPQIMLGYLDDEEATKRTIRPDGWMHTGDIGFFDEKGYLYLTDRAKELIKYKGLQVPPAELEAVIGSMAQVKDVIVIPVPCDEAGEVPRAYVVKHDNAPADFNEKAVIDFVHKKVAPHKRLRGGVFFTDSVPKSASGKLLRRLQIEMDRKLNPTK